jgi:hypothetical protein
MDQVGQVKQFLNPKNKSSSYVWITRVEDGKVYGRFKKRGTAFCDIKLRKDEDWNTEKVIPSNYILFK